MLPAIKDSGAIAVLVPFLARERVDIGGLPAAQVQLEALHALYNICKFNKVGYLNSHANACTRRRGAGGLKPYTQLRTRWRAGAFAAL